MNSDGIAVAPPVPRKRSSTFGRSRSHSLRLAAQAGCGTRGTARPSRACPCSRGRAGRPQRSARVLADRGQLPDLRHRGERNTRRRWRLPARASDVLCCAAMSWRRGVRELLRCRASGAGPCGPGARVRAMAICVVARARRPVRALLWTRVGARRDRWRCACSRALPTPRGAQGAPAGAHARRARPSRVGIAGGGRHGRRCSAVELATCGQSRTRPRRRLYADARGRRPRRARRSREPAVARARSGGEVIVFHMPCEPEREYAKRVVAIAGDTVEIRWRGALHQRQAAVPLRARRRALLVRRLRRDGGHAGHTTALHALSRDARWPHAPRGVRACRRMAAAPATEHDFPDREQMPVPPSCGVQLDR